MQPQSFTVLIYIYIYIYGFKENRGFTWSQYLTCSHASLRLTATDAFTFSMAKPSCISTPCFPQETVI